MKQEQKSVKKGAGSKMIMEVKSGPSPRVHSYLLPLDRLSEANYSWIAFGLRSQTNPILFYTCTFCLNFFFKLKLVDTHYDVSFRWTV